MWQRLSAMTSSVQLIRNVGTWKIVITVLTELHRQRFRAPHCELLQPQTGSLQLKASHRCLKLHFALLQWVQASREARTVLGTQWVYEADCCSIRRPFHSNKSNTFCWNNIRLSARPLYYYQRINVRRISMKFGIFITKICRASLILVDIDSQVAKI